MRLNAGNEPHKCAAIFIDNSGVDVILGILPFVEHLLSRGTEVWFDSPNANIMGFRIYPEKEIKIEMKRCIKLFIGFALRE